MTSLFKKERKKKKKTQSADYKFLRSCILSTKSLSYLVTLKSNLPNPDSGVNLIPEIFYKDCSNLCVSFNDLFLKNWHRWSHACMFLFFLIYPKFFLSKVCMWLSIGVRVPIFSQPYANNMQEMQKLE